MSDRQPETPPAKLAPSVLDTLSPEGIRDAAEGLGKTKAEREAQGYADRDLDDDARTAEHYRTQDLRTAIHRTMIAGVWCAFALGFVGMLCFVWNELAPDRWQWMSDAQKTMLRTFFFSSAVSALVGKYMSSRVQ